MSESKRDAVVEPVRRSENAVSRALKTRETASRNAGERTSVDLYVPGSSGVLRFGDLEDGVKRVLQLDDNADGRHQEQAHANNR